MEQFPRGVAAAWSFPLVPALLLLLTSVIYLRGWTLARRTRPSELAPIRAFYFLTGMVFLWIAIASPIDALDDYLLSAHMLQHFILMSVAPPLIVLSAPTVPLLRGLPRWLIRAVLGPVYATRAFQAVVRFVANPLVAWLAMNIAYLAWHIPAAFELTLRSEAVHNTEHLCFLFTSIAFWWAVITPWPSSPRWSPWAYIPYLLSADIVNTLLSAVLCFSGRVLYPSYAAAERLSRLTPLQDQVAAGSEMWVLNSIIFLVPVAVITMRLLSPRSLQSQASA